MSCIGRGLDLLSRRRAILAMVSAVFTLLLVLQAGARTTRPSASPAGQIPQPTPTPQPTISTNPILLTDPVPDPHQAGVEWFAPTGHTLRGPFLDYWQSHGGLAQFGYPITEEFTEPSGPNNSPLSVQYFERNRFEHHPENQPPNDVLLGRLGVEFHPPDPPVTALANAQYFPQTGHNLSGAFLDYWQSHGGLAIHGYPISEQVSETNPIDHKPYMVQYFERSRFEYHPENAGTPYEVLLGMLGVQLARQKGYPYGWYPLYGHSPDYSWIAGWYKADPRKCMGCLCSTVHFISPNDTTYPAVTEVWPYFPDNPQRYWLDVNGLQSAIEPTIFIVILGQLDDPSSIGSGPPIASCYSPKFRVATVQLNPAR